MSQTALYLEADEDITSAIDKLMRNPSASVQVVVPKRSTMLQSIINLKLLKKAASDAGKELVLVTNDKIATELAGRVGLAVAPSLGAKPVIPEVTSARAPQNEDIIEDDDAVASPAVMPVAPVAKRPLFARRSLDDKAAIVGGAAVASKAVVPASAEIATPGTVQAAASAGPHVPNFDVLKRRVIWVGLAAVLIVGYVVLMAVFTKATVTLYAAGSKVPIDATFSVDPNGKTSASDAVLSGQKISSTKDVTGTFTATGQKDVGTKALGQMTVKNEYDTSPHTLSAGTRFAAPDGKVFKTNSEVTVPGATPVLLKGKPSIQAGSVNVAVTADANGDSYNEAPARYTIVAYAGEMQANIYGQGSQMGGGTSKVITVVSQTDIDKAKADILAKDKDAPQTALKAKVPAGFQALPGSFTETPGAATSSPAIDAEAGSATLTVPVTYILLAVDKAAFASFIAAQEQGQIGKENQIYDDGLSTAEITAADKDDKGRPRFKLSTDAYSGLRLDTAAIAALVAGKRYGDASAIASKQAGVQRAEVVITPSWATSLPKNARKIRVIIQVAGNKG